MTNPHRTRGFLFPDEELPKKKKQPSRWVKLKKDISERFDLMSKITWEGAFLFLVWIAAASLMATGLIVLGRTVFTKDVVNYCYIKQGNIHNDDKSGYYLMGSKDWHPDSSIAGPFKELDEARKHAEIIGCPMMRK